MLCNKLQSNQFIEKFKDNIWWYLRRSEKLFLLQKMEGLLAEMQNRTPKEVKMLQKPNFVMISDDKSDRSYNPNYYDIGWFCFDGYDCLKKLAHESRHAYQYGILTGEITIQPIDELRLNLWNMNFWVDGIYYNDDIDPTDYFAVSKYRFQPLELDAFDYSYNIMQLLEAFFVSDEEYCQFMNELNESREFYETIAKECYGNNYINVIAKLLEEEYECKVKIKNK